MSEGTLIGLHCPVSTSWPFYDLMGQCDTSQQSRQKQKRCPTAKNANGGSCGGGIIVPRHDRRRRIARSLARSATFIQADDGNKNKEMVERRSLYFVVRTA